MGRKKRGEHHWAMGWQFVTAVVLALVSSATAIITNLDKIEPAAKKIVGRFWTPSTAKKTKPVSKPSGTKRVRVRVRRVVVPARPPQEAPTEATDGPETEEDLSERRSRDGGDVE
jgi:hypothetical protein